VLQALVEQGNTVVVIEVIKTAYWVIDLRPAGDDKGGETSANRVLLSA